MSQLLLAVLISTSNNCLSFVRPMRDCIRSLHSDDKSMNPVYGTVYTRDQTNGARPRAPVLAGTSTHPLNRAEFVSTVFLFTFLTVLGELGICT